MEFDDLKHAQRERLIFLDQCLTWRGMANRRDLIDRFDISTAQAALDFRLYLERARHTPPTYDPVRKTYLAALDHKPLVPSTLNEAFAAVLAESNLPLSVALPQPERRADASVVSRLYQAMRNRWAIHVQYTSMTSGADAGQWIVPTHFVSDGEKVHVRAFSFKHEAYRTYLPIASAPAVVLRRVRCQSSSPTTRIGTRGQGYGSGQKPASHRSRRPSCGPNTASKVNCSASRHEKLSNSFSIADGVWTRKTPDSSG
ncbi:hypothetical protein AJ87_40545 [Rhizobium yanglingense]|nr:hypothetical protein AJ87_40545 [Rhizobium yanglingense]